MEEIVFSFYPFYNSKRFEFPGDKHGMNILESERKCQKRSKKLFPDRLITNGDWRETKPCGAGRS